MKKVEDASEIYRKNIEKVFSRLSEDGILDLFAEAMVSRETMAAVDIMCAKNDVELHLVRGQISICDELAKWALSALEAHMDEAKSKYEEEIPEER